MNPLLDHTQRDAALRDLMPVIDWLASADAAFYDGAPGIGLDNLRCALDAFRGIPKTSPAVKAYTRWLDEQTQKVTP